MAGSSKQRAALQAQFAAHKKRRLELQRKRTDANRRRTVENHIARHPNDMVAQEALTRR